MHIFRLCLLGACAGTNGCSETVAACEGVLCGALPPAITFQMLDGIDGGTVPGARVNGLDCSAVCPGQLADGGLVEQAGTFEFTADAPGYVDLRFEVVVPIAAPVVGQCCPVPFVPQHRDVALTPL